MLQQQQHSALQSGLLQMQTAGVQNVSACKVSAGPVIGYRSRVPRAYFTDIFYTQELKKNGFARALIGEGCADLEPWSIHRVPDP